MSHPASVRARRAGGLAVLTLGAFTFGVPATALAAPGDEAADAGGTSEPEAGLPALEVLPTEPLPETTDGGPDAGAEPETTPAGAHFGWGKLEPGVVLAPGSSLPAGAVLDRTGAQVRVSYSRVWGDDTSDTRMFADGPPVLECTWDESDADGNGNLCDFSGDDSLVDGGRAGLYPESVFTVELIAAPTSGQVLLPAAGDRAIQGYTDWSPFGPVSAVFEAPGAHRDAPAVVSPADTDPPVSPVTPVAVPTVPEQSGPTAPESTPAPTPAAVTPAATTGAPAASGTGRELASTGAEPVPVLALGTGLVLAGGAVIAVSARRRTR